MLDYLEDFDAIYARASERKGGANGLKALLGAPASKEALSALGDDRYLAAFTKKIFQSGFVWKVVENKWPGFEETFFGFDIDKVLMMPDDMLERKASDPAIIRNFRKVKTIRDNALMIRELSQKHGGFGHFIADWPSEDIVGLWAELKKRGQRLGGNTGPFALRALGKDTFLLTQDVIGYFSQREIISGSAISKRSLKTIQQAFNRLQQQSDWSLQALSQLLAFSVGDNHR
ncbi:DNA-3-methyladenine glycosylase I [Saliniradius amylolyticus]|uniref:DNA-3-methyladenine glycosylase I n=1 Tax=Saliniradius amylolyticus TaxID=2183582 RepID=A0A2S2E6L6_9ALTE|nr:DNA-3-methyladenine glycosylase I [Saliniradius amylolyticus]AWL13249.1 DNA-3-methyladenine glycosylase I [Saliniradius amylolyticus]